MKKNFARLLPLTLTLLSLSFTLAISARAVDTEKVLFNFQGGAYGSGPAGNVRDSTGNIYGLLSYSPSTTCARFCGVVYKLTPTANGYTETIIHTFTGGADGETPDGMVMDAKGNIFVSTYDGASTKCFGGCGAIVEFSPIKSGGYSMTIVYEFVSLTDGGEARLNLIDSQGNLYGWSPHLDGLIWKLSPSSSGTWTKTTLYNFTGGSDGSVGIPAFIDASGNLFGVASTGGSSTNCTGGCGVVFELSPNANGTWSESVLYTFTGAPDGASPESLIADGAGNLFGVTYVGGTGTDSSCTILEPSGCGTLFQLSRNSSGGYTETILHSFNSVLDGRFPISLTPDPAGNLYVATSRGGVAGIGTVLEFMLGSDGIWHYTTLRSFAGGSGGGYPSLFAIDSSGDLFGEAIFGGTKGYGVLFELLPPAAK